MLTTHRISDELYDDSFELIAIYSDLENHAMAYAINSECGLFLKRMDKDLNMEDRLNFAIFDWDDEIGDAYWCLISNSCAVEEAPAPGGLFNSGFSIRRHHLVKELREVDYFLKVESADGPTILRAINKIKALDKVKTAYTLEFRSLKSKRNLIF